MFRKREEDKCTQGQGVGDSNRTWLLFLGVLGYTLYGIGLDIKLYGDDFQVYFGSGEQGPLFYLFHKNPYNAHAYRP